MSRRSFQVMAAACLFAGALWAGSDSFVGKWKLNPSRTHLTDQMKIEAAGAHKYVFDFGGGNLETVVADGTDQPGISGTTLSVTIFGPATWRIVRKKQGRVLLSAIWKLSPDGKTLTDTFRGNLPDGSMLSVDDVYKRLGPGSGFVGTWETENEKVISAYEVQIQLSAGDGLSFITPAEHETQSMKFDGKDYPAVGPNVPRGAASSGRRLSTHALEITDKINGSVVATKRIDLSSDLKTLTMTVHRPGHNKPNILVFDRE